MTPIPVLVVVGPTAVGKTEVALALAAALDAEIVGADSRQVYRHLDVGTAKPTAAERARVPHHLLDVVDPDAAFDAAQFRRLALAAVRNVHARGRAVIVCGGTGLYVRALLHGLFRGPAADADLRRTLLDDERRLGVGTLHARLAAVDVATAARLHPRDLLRVVRALEVHTLTGRPISAWQEAHRFQDGELQARVIGCERPPGELAARIADRCTAMLAGGLADEIRSLWARGYDPALPALQSVGYREIGAYLRGTTSYDDACEAFRRATRRLAKRQRTWFRADGATRWFHPERDRDAVIAYARAWLTSSAWLPPTSTSNAPSPR